ncbi:MAG: Tol-Pal system beta propeller repeat protein TolB [Desulfurivibrionaceae bacterium]
MAITLSAHVTQADDKIYLDITGAKLRKLTIAVPAFQNKNQPGTESRMGREMADILSRAIEFHGFIKTLALSDKEVESDQKLSSLGVDYKVKGQYELTDRDLVLEIKLIEAGGNRTALGLRYEGEKELQKRFLLRYSDRLVEKLTGQPGVSTSKIAFVSDSSGSKEIYLSDILGDNNRKVTGHKVLAIFPRLSPDGSKLVYTSYHRGNANLYLTDLNQSRITRAISRRQGINMAPSWTPDSKRLVATLSKDGNPDLYLIKPNGSIIKRLTKNSGINVSPDFSPDGRKIVFVSDRSGTPQLYIMDMKTKTTERLTFSGSENTTPSWSPDGEWIAYTGRENDYHQIYKIRAEGGDPVQLTDSSYDHESPNWSPDSRHLIFSRKSNESSKLVVMSSNGRWPRPLFLMDGNQSSPHWGLRY